MNIASIYGSDGVRQERTGWRDQEISERHRMWGFNCPAVDLDFLMVEYNKGKPVGLIEYKHHRAEPPNVKHPTYRALQDLADGYREPLPFMIAFYWPEVWAFRIWPVNNIAKQHFGHNETVTEFEYVRRLYRMRRITLARELKDKLLHVLPQVNP